MKVSDIEFFIINEHIFSKKFTDLNKTSVYVGPQKEANLLADKGYLQRDKKRLRYFLPNRN